MLLLFFFRPSHLDPLLKFEVDAYAKAYESTFSIVPTVEHTVQLHLIIWHLEQVEFCFLYVQQKKWMKFH